MRLEILHRRGLEYYEALLPAVIGSLSGYVVNLIVSHLGVTSIWRFPQIGAVHQVDLVWGAACGVVGAALAVVFTYLTRMLQWAFRHLHPAVRPLVGGLALGGLAFWSPYALTFGEAQINGLLVTKAAAATFGVAMLAKLCGTTVTLSSGWRGGFIIPLFFMGVALGRFGHVLFPGTNEVVLMAALMAAANCGVTKTPLGSAVVVAEMAGLRLLPPVLIASVVALFLTSEVGLIHSQQARESPLTSTDRPIADDEVDHGEGPVGSPARGERRTVSRSASLSLLEYQQLARFRRALRAFLRFSDDAATGGRVDAGAAPTAARHQGSCRAGCAERVRCGRGTGAAVALGGRADQPGRSLRPVDPSSGPRRRPPPPAVADPRWRGAPQGPLESPSRRIAEAGRDRGCGGRAALRERVATSWAGGGQPPPGKCRSASLCAIHRLAI